MLVTTQASGNVPHRDSTNDGGHGSNPGGFLTKSDGIDLYYGGTVEASGITFYAVK